MKKYSSRILILWSMMFLLTAWTQKDQQEHKQKEGSPEKVIKNPKVLFYDDTPTSGVVHRDKLLNALRHPLRIKDEEGKIYPVIFYQYLHAHLDVFEDEFGAIIFLPEYFNTYSKEGLLPQHYLKQFDQFASFGDTLVIEDVRFLNADSSLSEQRVQGLRIFVDH